MTFYIYGYSDVLYVILALEISLLQKNCIDIYKKLNEKNKIKYIYKKRVKIPWLYRRKGGPRGREPLSTYKLYALNEIYGDARARPLSVLAHFFTCLTP